MELTFRPSDLTKHYNVVSLLEKKTNAWQIQRHTIINTKTTSIYCLQGFLGFRAAKVTIGKSGFIRIVA